MIDFQEKKQIKKILYSKITLVFLGVLVVFLIFKSFGVYQKYETSKNNLAKVNASLEELKAKEFYLKTEIERLSSKGGIEEEIREKYGLVKPNEEVIVILNEEGDSDKQEVKKGFWANVLKWFNQN